MQFGEEPEQSRSTVLAPTVWYVKSRLGARTSKSKAKPAFPIHSILSSMSSKAINTVTLFGGRHAGSALRLISCLFLYREDDHRLGVTDFYAYSILKVRLTWRPLSSLGVLRFSQRSSTVARIQPSRNSAEAGLIPAR